MSTKTTSATEAILAQLASKLSPEEMAQIRAAAASDSFTGGKISAKVSSKGAISVYGLQRMPVTLYPEQWERLFANREYIMGVAAAGAAAGVLSTKTHPKTHDEAALKAINATIAAKVPSPK